MPEDVNAVGKDAASAEADEATFLDAFESAVAALERGRVPYVLMGGLASAVYGRPRWTSDIDLLVKPEDARRALDALADGGFVTEETNPHWIYKAWRDDVVIDVIFVITGGIYLDDDMLARSRIAAFKGRDARVIPPEDLVVIKAVVHDEPSARHWHDALSIVATTELDWDYLVRRAAFGARRVLSLLIYAQSSDLVVPERAIRDLFETVYGA
jgi:hypothetical protein